MFILCIRRILDSSPEETKRTIAEYRARGRECLNTAIAMELCLEMPGQMEVDDVLV